MIRILLFICCFPLLAQAQEHDLNWGAPQMKRGMISELYLKEEGDFYAQEITGNAFVSTNKLSRYENGNRIVAKRISEKFDNAIVSLETVVYFKGKLLAFFSDKKDGNNMLYIQEMDSEIDPIGEPVLISSYPLPKTFGDKGHFSIQLSENGALMVVEYVIPAKKDAFNRYGYSIYNEQLKVLTEGEYELPIPAKTSSVDIRHLSNSGNYFIGVTLFNTSNSNNWFSSSTIDGAAIYQVAGDSLVQFNVQLDEERIVDFQLATDQEHLIVTGTYGDRVSRVTKGFFFKRFELKDGSSQNLTLQPFEELSHMRRNRSDRQGSGWIRGNSDGYLNYAFRNVVVLPNGNVVVVAEQFSIVQQISGDVKGMSQTILHYYYDDILVYCIDTSGNVKWSQTIPKEQHSTNDYGYYSSFALAQYNNSIYLYFNDTRRNYQDNGSFNEWIGSISFPIRKKMVVLAETQIACESGEVNRAIFSNYLQSNGIVVPRLCAENKAKRQLLFYAVGRKEQFGWVQF